MAIPDVHEDTATMGANAASRLIDRNDIDPNKIGRIYLGTESALDGAKAHCHLHHGHARAEVLQENMVKIASETAML